MNKDKKIAMILYGFPPGVGATGTAALLNVPKSIDETLATLRKEGYDLGVKEGEPLPTGEAIVLALRNLEEVSAIMLGAQKGGEQALSKTRRDIAKIKREEEKEDEIRHTWRGTRAGVGLHSSRPLTHCGSNQKSKGPKIMEGIFPNVLLAQCVQGEEEARGRRLF